MGFASNIIATCESLGETEVRANLLAGAFGNTPDHPHRRVVEDWLRSKELKRNSDTSAKRDAREEETLAIAREANDIARSASFAASAAASAAIAANDIARSTRRVAIAAAVIAIATAIAQIIWR